MRLRVATCERARALNALEFCRLVIEASVREAEQPSAPQSTLADGFLSRQLHVSQQRVNLADVIAGQGGFDFSRYVIKRLSRSHRVAFVSWQGTSCACS